MQRGSSSLDADRPTTEYKSQESNQATKLDMVDVAVADVPPPPAATTSSSKKKWLIAGAISVVVLAGAGAATAIVLVKKSNSSTSSSSDAAKGSTSSTAAPTIPPVDDGDLLGPSGNSTGSSGSQTSVPSNPKSDPEAATAALTMLAIGDWGSTTGKEFGVPGSCCKLYKPSNLLDTSNPRYKVDFWSQRYVATLLGQSAAELKPSRIIGHGDNMYWNGVGSLDWKYRFEETFEKVYDAPSLQGIKWVNVAGNHDIGGSTFICGEQDNQFVECASTAEMLKYLNERFDLQAQYVSPNQNRYGDDSSASHYYVERVTKNDVTVDIFNLDTNYADSHGGRQVCCQCYGYSQKYGYDSSKCNDVVAGDAACAVDSYMQAARDMKASTADFKIINTHYSPHFHMTPDKMKKWYKLTKDTNVAVWFNGHTHGFNHDIANWGTHFIENGGGGGIVTETSTGAQNEFLKSQWIAAGNPYGFMELSFSKDWLKVQFATFDTAWQFGGVNYADTVQGGVNRGHCCLQSVAKMSSSAPVDPASVQVPVSSEGASLLHGGAAPAATAAKNTKFIALGVAAVAAVGTGIYFLVSPSANLNVAPANVEGGDNTTSTTLLPLTAVATSVIPATTTATTPTVVATTTGPVTDPEAMVPALTFLAIGDWGSTVGKEWGEAGSCCRLYKNGQVDTSTPRYQVDYYAQKYVATLMAQSATELKPVRILGHGDNFYWNGVGPWDVNYRFAETFEKMYADPALQGIKWLNVAGNHDIGGSAFICGPQDKQFRECASVDEMIKDLRSHFDLQANYKSPNQDRWVLKHYFVERVSKNGVSVDVFNLDTNHADAHGAMQVCCQCYGYAAKLGVDNVICRNTNVGDATCAGGSVEMFNTCMAEIESWATDSYTQAARDIKASTADFKIINTHYSPHHHMNPMRMKKWYDLTKDTGVHVWFNGHTHGFGHDISTWGTQWVAGGTPYGFMELSFSKDWLKVQFATFDKAWKFGGLKYPDTVTGGIQRGHCWYVPAGNATGPGKECKSSINYAIGAPLR
ncbi:hypothetical protein DYB25_000921 [Aphanomyces astaci]|uniref:Calcineurin-like phosphoesterase domain-containing protein n=2 Tax=Aphanomyces astaci TaxID=112090 RepID=A0A397A269_APHAT|nr:hypothetical protein DYB25_000921 [Aphanomyces astaci]RHY08099.1 hypothetical protein DYB36_001233 [Aphanomyces astaci]RHY63315.1 hypothetical protein DYB34_001570 [Aphanomyces astaci]RHZ14892.1 hypothetical protein DYB31_005112 [Aphanomyces astaci]